ncbi:MAG: hypothetical protein ACWGNK_09175, partial [Desulfobacterales bacterium]
KDSAFFTGYFFNEINIDHIIRQDPEFRDSQPVGPQMQLTAVARSGLTHRRPFIFLENIGIQRLDQDTPAVG